MIKKALYLPILLSLAFLLLSCASSTPPSGGPDDKTGPSILYVTPAAKAVGVSTDSRIVFTFSEWISPKSKNSISIFPPINFNAKVFRNKLEIDPLSKLQDSITYHIVITTTLQDLHGNSISPPYSLTFSTGAALDSGTIQGCIIDPSRKLLQPKVALFSLELEKDSGLSKSPSYLLQTDSAGAFSFNQLKIGKYRMLAYLDINNDSRLQSGTEQVYMPLDRHVSITEKINDVILFPAQYDTTCPHASALKATGNVTLSATWSKPFDTLVFKNPEIVIERTDSSSQITNIAYHSLGNNFIISLGKPLKIAPYRLILSIGRTFDTVSIRDTLLFNGTTEIDTTKPEFKAPAKISVNNFKPTIPLTWSEPVLMIDSLQFNDSTGNSILGKLSRGYSNITAITFPKSLKPGMKYNAVIFKNYGRDFYNNPLQTKDSTDTVTTITINTPDIDSMANSIQGRAQCLSESKNLKWIFFPLDKTGQYITNNDSGNFSFDTIPAQKGLIGYFNDNNNNNKPDSGKVLPWIAPEPFFMNPDTIEGLPRWDVEGIEIQACEPCTKKKQVLESEPVE
jgi:hypothetical protein